MSHGRGWNQECAEGPGSGGVGQRTGSRWLRQLLSGSAHCLIKGVPHHQAPQAGSRDEQPRTNGSLPYSQLDRRRPELRGRGLRKTGSACQEGFGRVGTRAPGATGRTSARALRARVLPALGSVPAAREAPGRPRGWPLGPDRWRRREWRSPVQAPGIGARRPASASACPSGGSPRDQLAQPTEVSGPSGRGRGWPGGVWGGACGERRGERDRGRAGSGEAGPERGGGPERVGPGSRCAGSGEGGGLESRRVYRAAVLLGAGTERGGFYGRGLLAWGRSPRREASRRGDWSLQLQVI